MSTLFSFIGNSDLVAAGVEQRGEPNQGPGPISRTLASGLDRWELLVLVDERAEDDRAQRYGQWLASHHPGQDVRISRRPVANPAQFEPVLEAAHEAVSAFAPDLAERAYLTTPGTAAMGMAWMFLALQPSFRARLLTAHLRQPCAWLSVPGTQRRECIILRGIPGSGKSTLAHELARGAGLDPAAAVFSTDDRFTELNDGAFDPSLLARMHQVNLASFIAALERREPLVVCDNTNIEPWNYTAYEAAARALGYRVTVRIVGDAADDAFVQACIARNRRGVPEDRIRDMARRLQGQGVAT